MERLARAEATRSPAVAVRFALSCPSRPASWLALGAVMALALALAPQPAAAHSSDAMTDEMARLSRIYWTSHAPHGGRSTASGTANATVQVVNTSFIPNQVTITVGESVTWLYGSGFHTTTNGTDPFDPSAGALWDAPIDPGSTVFERQFNDVGTFPYFCQFHGSFGMTGVVEVLAATAVEPAPGEAGRIGFVSAPAPNPTRGRVAFRFGLTKDGHVQLRVLDTAGRLVAAPIDDSFEAGTYSAAWDGRTRAGQPAKAGVYYLTLSVPGARQTRTIALQR